MRSADVLAAALTLVAVAAASVAGCSSDLDDAPDFELVDASTPGRTRDDAGSDPLDGPSSDAGCEGVDLESDPRNCGACRRDCLGGACNAGVCGPVELAAGLNIPQGLAVARDALYATVYGEGKIIRLDKKTPGTPTTVTTATSSPSSLAVEVDATGNAVRVVWGETRGTTSNLLVCALPTCTSPSTVPATESVRDVIVEGDKAYWTEASSTEGRVRSCTVSDCAATAADVLTTESDADGIAIRDGALFVTRRDSPGRIRRVMLGTTSATDFVTGVEDPRAVAADGTRLYAVHGGSPGGLVACALAGCSGTATPLAEAVNPHDVATDGKHVFWGTGLASGGAVFSCPVNGCGSGPTTLASDQQNPFTLGFDDDALYWTNSSVGGSVMKIRKP